MKNWILVLFIGSFGIATIQKGWSQSSVKVDQLYEQLSGENEEGLASILEEIGEPSSNRDKASKGVVLMKLAGYQSTPGEKLSTFKQGHELLEMAIEKEPENSEFLFFRLLIQENAPRILGYNDNISADAANIVDSYGELPKDLKNAILAYSKTSKALNSEDLE